MDEKNIIKFENIEFFYDNTTPLLKNFNLEIKKGKYTVLLGHNGSGKSTIAKLIIGLLVAKNGKIYVDNLELNEENVYKIRENVAIVFQNPDNQFIGSTVRDDIAFGLENRCVDPKKMDEIIEKFAKKVKMEKFLDQEPSNLSGGQKQRVAIAGALALNPSLLILDEATSMLDPQGRKEMFDVIFNLRKENLNMSILSITHHIDEAIFADEIVVINKGMIIKKGTATEILEDINLLQQHNLDAPFTIKLIDKLQKNGFKVNKTLLLEELVKQL